MPYHVAKQGARYCVIKDSDGKNMGCHDTRREAEAQIAAIHANEGAHAMSETGVTIGEVSTTSDSTYFPALQSGWLQTARDALGQGGIAPGITFAVTYPEELAAVEDAPVADEEEIVPEGDRGEPWEGILGLEGAPTSDGRMLIAGEIDDRELPLPINAQFVTDDGHKHSENVGRIDAIERFTLDSFDHPDFDLSKFDLPETTVVIWASGTFDQSDEAAKAQAMIDNGAGISLDLPTERVALFHKDTLEEVDLSTLTEEDIIFGEFVEGAAGKIGGATIVTVPAFEEARIQITRENVLVASAYGMKVKRVRALVASAGPVKPPAEWFRDPEFDELTPWTVTKDGRVFGHLADWDGCHIGFNGVCVPPFRSATDFAYFNCQEIETAEGELIGIGKVMFSRDGVGHAPTDDPSMTYQDVQAFYDDATCVGALVRAGSDRYGTWIAGALAPGLNDLEVQHMRTHGPSGDWRPIRPHDRTAELIAAMAVPIQGFQIARRALVASANGEITAIITAPLQIDAMGSKKRWRKRKMLSQRLVTALGHKPSSKERMRREMVKERKSAAHPS